MHVCDASVNSTYVCIYVCVCVYEYMKACLCVCVYQGVYVYGYMKACLCVCVYQGVYVPRLSSLEDNCGKRKNKQN